MRLKQKEKLHQKRMLPIPATKKYASKNSKTFTTLVTSLAKWFSEAARPLPWRKTIPNPYEIWISEIMSQQSTLKMMLPFFDKWMKRFPRIEDVANAQEEELLKHWEGLGYYSRARNIHKAAKLLTHKFPSDPASLRTLPGIGAYTSAAIASIAFDYPVIPIDGNVTRVLSRYFGVSDPFGNKEDAKWIQELATEIAKEVPVGERAAVAQAFMELGALVCKPAAQAQCFVCPLQKSCVAKKQGQVGLWPIPKKRPEMKKLSRLLLLYRNKKGELLLRQRPKDGVLGGQWELPYLDLEATDAEVKVIFGSSFELHRPFKHTIMHRSYTVWPLELGLGPKKLDADHVYLRGPFQGVLSTITRKFVANSLKKSID